MYRIIPEKVELSELFHDIDPMQLFEAEVKAVASAVQLRRREFNTTRWCARDALAKLGILPVPILPGPDRAPIWPSGVVGSMTHCEGYRAAAVAWRADILSIGIDAEPHANLPRDVSDLVIGNDEANQIRHLERLHPEVCWDRIIFSAKESVFKGWFPLTKTWLDFHQVRVTVHPASHTFTATFLIDEIPPLWQGPASILGRWSVHESLVFTSVVRHMSSVLS